MKAAGAAPITGKENRMSARSEKGNLLHEVPWKQGTSWNAPEKRDGLWRFDMTENKEGLNGYVCFYRGKRIEVYSDSIYHAQLEAAKQFKAKKSYEVNVALAELHGEPVVHVAVD